VPLGALEEGEPVGLVNSFELGSLEGLLGIDLVGADVKIGEGSALGASKEAIEIVGSRVGCPRTTLGQVLLGAFKGGFNNGDFDGPSEGQTAGNERLIVGTLLGFLLGVLIGLEVGYFDGFVEGSRDGPDDREAMSLVCGALELGAGL